MAGAGSSRRQPDEEISKQSLRERQPIRRVQMRVLEVVGEDRQVVHREERRTLVLPTQ